MADTGGGTPADHRRGPDARLHHGAAHLVGPAARPAGRRPGSAPARFGAARAGRRARAAAGHRHDAGRAVRPAVRASASRRRRAGHAYEYRRVRESSWWCQDNDVPRVQPVDGAAAPRLPRRASPSTWSPTPPSTPTRWSSGSTTTRPVRGRGAGDLPARQRKGATAGCVSVPAEAMAASSRWADPSRKPAHRDRDGGRGHRGHPVLKAARSPAGTLNTPPTPHVCVGQGSSPPEEP